jgi:hypothetical protein
MKKILLCLVIIILSGCNNKEYSADLSIVCDGVKSNFNVKKDNIISCKLSNINYEFKIKSINENEIKLETNSNDLEDNKNTFSIKKDNELSLYTKSKKENILIIWK